METNVWRCVRKPHDEHWPQHMYQGEQRVLVRAKRIHGLGYHIERCVVVEKYVLGVDYQRYTYSSLYEP